MILKITYLICLYLVILAYSTIFILGSFPLTLNKESTNYFKSYIQKVLNYMYQKAFSKIYYTGEYKKTDKIDIIISNHTNSIDFILNTVLADNFDKKNIHFFIKRNTSYIPAIGFIASSSADILINRNIEDDKNIIINKIKKINNGVIIIMPEGTRYTPEKYEKAIKYSKDNNLPIFENTLYPKMKGLYYIIKTLRDSNKLGNLIDFTINIENIMGKKAYLPYILKNDIGDTKVIINSYHIPKDNTLDDYDDFKKWFLNIWKEKDIKLNKINDYKYQKLPVKISFMYVISLIILLSLFFFINIETKFKFIFYSMIIIYIIIFARNTREKQWKN
jgi:1-acyl-sn-glycerol-3-phosphate acyltransferase